VIGKELTNPIPSWAERPGMRPRRARRRFIAGADSIGSTEQKVAELQADIALNRERFVSLDVEEA